MSKGIKKTTDSLDTLDNKDFLKCAGCVCFNLRRAARAVTQAYDDIFREAGLRGNQFSILVVALLRGPIALSKMAELLVMDRTTLTRNLKPLEKKSYLAISSGDDKRRKIISITDEGKDLLTEALPLWTEAQEQVKDRFGMERTENLVDELQNLTANV